MANELVYTASVDDAGQLKIVGRKGFDDDMRAFSGQRLIIRIKKYRKSRSNKQNSVLHWYINEISDETGMSKDIVKEVLKKKFLTTDVTGENNVPLCDESTGEIIQYVKSTTDLTTVEFNEFTENIRVWAREFLNLHLPLPNENGELKF